MELNKVLKHFSRMSLSLATNEMTPRRSDMVNMLKDVGILKQQVSAFKRYLIIMGNEIDNRIDEMSPSEIINSGNVRIGKEPSEFILNPNIITEENWNCFDRLTELGVISRDTLVSIGNLYAENIRQEAYSAQKIMDSSSSSERANVGEFHLRLGELSYLVISSVFRPNEELNSAVESGLSYEVSKEIYPMSSNLWRIIQMQDDVVDLRDDIASEIKLCKPAGNFLISKLVERNGLELDKGIIINPQIDQSVLAISMKESQEEYRDLSSKLPFHVRAITNRIWSQAINKESSISL